MLNIIAIKDTEENKVQMAESIDSAMKIIDLYPDVFPHLVGQGFKLKKYFNAGTVIIQNGVVITFGKYKSSGSISRNSSKSYQSVPHKPAKVYKKNGDYILHQIASDRTDKEAAKNVLDEFVKYCKSNQIGRAHV